MQKSINGHEKYATQANEIRHARFPDGTTSHSTKPASGQVAGYLPIPLDETTSDSTKLQKTAAKSLVIPEGEGDKVSLREFHVKGFTLIEILVVLVIIGLLAGVALPRLYAISQRYEMAAQRKSLLTEIGNLGYRAYSSGQPAELTSLAASAASSAPISIPPGWRIETRQPISYSFNGICSGGKITLIGPDEFREELQLNPPLCKPVTGEGVP